MVGIATLDWCIIDYRNGHRDVLKLQMSSEGGELWRECLRWMADCQVIDHTHKALSSSQGMAEFANILRDGVLLCRLANDLIPGSVQQSEVKIRSISQFSCYKNICLFLGACGTNFRMAEKDLFEVSDLYNLHDFAKVLNTLSKLSYSDPALRLNIKPFPANPRSSTCSTLASSSQTTDDDEAIYKSLQDEVDEGEIDDSIYDTGGYRNLDENKIYDSIVCQRRDSQRKKEDQWAQFVPKTSRDHSIKELLDTEQNYVEKALNMIITKFQSPLQKHLDEPDHKTIFMNITTLWHLHHTFHSDLRSAVLNTLGLEGSDTRPTSMITHIGDVFVLHKDKFIAYGPYCMGLQASRERIMTIEKDSAKKAKIAECAASVNDNQFKLQDLLCLPMQRVLKYHMLLSAILKHTPIESPDRDSIGKAKDAMEDINSYVNEMKRDYETKLLVSDIEESIQCLQMPEGMTLIDYGRMHKDGEVKLCEVTKEGAGRMKQRHIFLFDKVLFICKSNRNNTFSYKNAYVLTELRPELDSCLPGNSMGEKFGTFTRKLNGTNWLSLVRDDSKSDGVKAINMAFKSLATMKTWFETIEKAKDNVRPEVQEGTGHHFHFHSYDIDCPVKCRGCDQLLKGLFLQGYKCDYCQENFHKDCIKGTRCVGSQRRRTTTSLTPSDSGSSLHMERRTLRVVAGDRVVATTRCSPTSDATFLSFEKDDIIEVQIVHPDNTFTGILLNSPQRRGVVHMEHVKRCRAASAILDSPVGPALRIDRKTSTLLPRAVAPINTPLPQIQDYVNTEVANQSWFMGNMERPEAEKKLKQTENGTFLVRYSLNRRQNVISVSYENEVKHMVVEEKAGHYFLDDGYNFDSIVQLIAYYRENNLIESFNSLNTTLKSPYRECKVFRVIHSFVSTEQKYLELRKGDTLTLVDTIGEDRGWWKGKINNKVGFFPMSYVEPWTESDDE